MNNYRLRPNRSGVSLVEVLFAMMIALFGLAGVLAIFPLAARQSAESYALNQATNGAIGYGSTAAATNMVVPSYEKPWCYDEDEINAHSPPASTTPLSGYDEYKQVRSLEDLYRGLFAKAQFRLPVGTTAEVIWRQIYGQGFCYDPIYAAATVGPVRGGNYGGGGDRVFDKQTMIIDRTSFPFLSETFNLPRTNNAAYFVDNALGLQPNPNATPITLPSPQARLIRVTNWDSQNGGPLKWLAAKAQMEAFGDLIQATIQEDKSFGALREFEGASVPGSIVPPSLISSPLKSDLSWFATLVPIETNADVIPQHFTLSIVVVQKRDQLIFLPADEGLDTSNVSDNTMPQFERVALCTAPRAIPATPNEALPQSSGGILTVDMYSDTRVEPDIKIGEYVMLSRTLRVAMPDQATNGPRFIYRHKWFRVVALGEDAEWPRRVTLQGPAWDYPEFYPSLPPLITAPAGLEARTIATIVPGVTAVYEFPVTISQ